MPREPNDLMDAVGETFGISDAPAQNDQSGDNQDTGGQHDDGGSFEQVHQQHEQDQGGRQDARTSQDGQQQTRGDRQQGKDQLFTEKPKRGPRGELLDKNGNIVASTRREKQLAFNLNRAQYTSNQLARSNKQLSEALGQYKELDGQIKAAGLNMQQAREAMEIRALADRDPITAVRDIVARVLASGVTMEQLFGGDAVPSINARVITNELDRRLGPMEKQQQSAARQQQIREDAQQAMESFLNEHPYAETHGVEISNLVDQYNMPPTKAYYELRSWAERRGFDFTAPLKPQIEAAMRRRQGGDNGGQQQQRRQSTPGDIRSVPANGQFSAETRNNNRGDFKSNAPWKDIASAVFTELNSNGRGR